MRLSKKFNLVFPIPNDPDKGEVTIRHIPPGEAEDIQDEMGVFSTVLKKGEDDKMEPEIRQNTGLGDKRYLLHQKAIVGWKNIKDAEGKDIPFSPENVLVVCREGEVQKDDGEVITFAAWVNECRAEVTKQKVANREAAAKN